MNIKLRCFQVLVSGISRDTSGLKTVFIIKLIIVFNSTTDEGKDTLRFILFRLCCSSCIYLFAYCILQWIFAVIYSQVRRGTICKQNIARLEARYISLFVYASNQTVSSCVVLTVFSSIYKFCQFNCRFLLSQQDFLAAEFGAWMNIDFYWMHIGARYALKFGISSMKWSIVQQMT